MNGKYLRVKLAAVAACFALALSCSVGTPAHADTISIRCKAFATDSSGVHPYWLFIWVDTEESISYTYDAASPDPILPNPMPLEKLVRRDVVVTPDKIIFKDYDGSSSYIDRMNGTLHSDGGNADCEKSDVSMPQQPAPKF